VLPTPVTVELGDQALLVTNGAESASPAACVKVTAALIGFQSTFTVSTIVSPARTRLEAGETDMMIPPAGVAVGMVVAVDGGVIVKVGVTVNVWVMVGDAVTVGVAVGVTVAVGVPVLVGVAVTVKVEVAIACASTDPANARLPPRATTTARSTTNARSDTSTPHYQRGRAAGR
jgi:hypothetical protein